MSNAQAIGTEDDTLQINQDSRTMDNYDRGIRTDDDDIQRNQGEHVTQRITDEEDIRDYQDENMTQLPTAQHSVLVPRNRELEKLQSANSPGYLEMEDTHEMTRRRILSLPALRNKYSELMCDIQHRVERLYAWPRPVLPHDTGSFREEFRELKFRE